MEPVIKDKSVLKREWYMMGYQDATLSIINRLHDKFVKYACAGDYYTELDIEKELRAIAKENRIDLDKSNRIAFVENFGVELNEEA